MRVCVAIYMMYGGEGEYVVGVFSSRLEAVKWAATDWWLENPEQIRYEEWFVDKPPVV